MTEERLALPARGYRTYGLVHSKGQQRLKVVRVIPDDFQFLVGPSFSRPSSRDLLDQQTKGRIEEY